MNSSNIIALFPISVSSSASAELKTRSQNEAFNKFVNKATGVFQWRTGSLDAAQDIVATAILKTCNAAVNGSNIKNVVSYLWQACYAVEKTVGTTFNATKFRAMVDMEKDDISSTSTIENLSGSTKNTFVEEFTSDYNLHLIGRISDTLTLMQLEVINLYFLSEFSLEDIAHQTGNKVENVRSIKCKALAKMKKRAAELNLTHKSIL